MKLVARAASRIPIANLPQPHNRDLWTVHLTINFISLKALVSEILQTVIPLLKDSTTPHDQPNGNSVLRALNPILI